MKILQKLGLLIGMGLMGCQSTPTESDVQTYILRGDTAIVCDTSYLSKHIKVDVVSSKPYIRKVITAGSVQPIPTQYAYIAPPFSGRVGQTFFALGDQVEKLTPLFQLVSSEYTSTQKEFYQAESERDLARTEWNRKQDLLHKGVAAQKELEEATNALHIAEKEYDNASLALQVYHTQPQKMTLGEPLVIRAPISGTVIENNVVTGQYLSSESESVAVIADLSKVWVVAQVKEKDIRFIHEGDRMKIQIAALPKDVIEGEVFHIDEAIDQETRSIKVLSVCDNKERMLKLGMYATVTFLDREREAIVLPEKALLQEENYIYVWKQIADKRYIKQPIEVEVVENGFAVINQGVSADDTVVIEGGYYLK